MASTNLFLPPNAVAILSACARTRKVQLPARTFQLLARSSNATHKQQVSEYEKVSWLHTACRRREEQPVGATNVEADPSQESVGQTKAWKHSNNCRSVDDSTTNVQPPVDTQPAPSSDLFRKYMRMVSQAVTIITSADSGPSDLKQANTWRGATVSSFNSVTLSPEPYVSFNIKKLSSTYTAIQQSNLFAVHLMSNTPEAVEIASNFSRGNDADPFFQHVVSGDELPRLHPFVHETPHWQSGSALRRKYLPPTLQWWNQRSTPAVQFHMLCEWHREKTAAVGDHVIVVGRVLEVQGLQDLEARDKSLKCLTYDHGEYSTHERSTELCLAPRSENSRRADKS